MNKYIYIIGVILIVSLNKLSAQQDFVTHFLRNTWQANLTNPALLPSDRKIHICSASPYANVSAPVSVSDFIVYLNGKRIVKPSSNAWVSALDEKSYMTSNINIQTFAASFPVQKNLFVSLHHAFNYNQYTDFNRDAIDILYRGNAAYIGKTVELGHNVYTYAFSEGGLGLTYKVENVSLGGRVKVYAGLGGVFTGKSDLSLTTDTSIYALTLKADYLLRTFTPNLNPVKALTDNGGYGVDLGMTARFSRLEVSFSALDLNADMRFKRKAKTYSAKGQDIFTGLNGVSLSNSTLEGLVDTLQTSLNIKEEDGGEFVANLPTRIYASALYRLTPQFRLGGLLYTELGKFENVVGASITGQYDVTPWLSAGMSFSMRDGRQAQIGMYSSARFFGKWQMFSATDNILAFFNPFDARSTNARIGMNFTLGEEQPKNKRKKGSKKDGTQEEPKKVKEAPKKDKTPKTTKKS